MLLFTTSLVFEKESKKNLIVLNTKKIMLILFLVLNKAYDHINSHNHHSIFITMKINLTKNVFSALIISFLWGG